MAVIGQVPDRQQRRDRKPDSERAARPENLGQIGEIMEFGRSQRIRSNDLMPYALFMHGYFPPFRHNAWLTAKAD
jgi:hypothetical protein